MITAFRLCITLSLVLTLSACEQKKESPDAGLPAFGAPDAPATTQAEAAHKPLPQPCSLVSAADAQAVTTQPMAEMARDLLVCAYNSTGGAGNAGNFTTLMVNLSDNDDEAMAVDVFRAIAGQSGKLNKMVNDQMGEKTRKSGQTFDGLGDEARLNVSNADLTSNTTLVVRKGRVVLTLAVIGMGGDPESGARLETLARKIMVAL